jgi:DegV family protein with EDD domain
MRGEHFVDAFRCGTLAVLGAEAHLNQINVFPVPDGDTGSNLTATLWAAGDLLGSVRKPSVAEAASLAAEGALDGARGNSGAIFAQFLVGFAEAVQGLTRLRVKDFSKAIARGTEAAFAAIHNPREGTILSVMRALAKALNLHDGNTGDFSELFKKALPAIRKALAHTPRQLDVLAQAGVVDAGGQGLVNFVEGFLSFFQSGKQPIWEPKPIDKTATDLFNLTHTEFSSSYRFCSEALLARKGLTRQVLVEAIEDLGDSLVIAGGGNKFRLHLHTNSPRRFFELVAGIGSLERCKIDDMWLQHSPKQQAPLGLVTDSTCDLPEAVSSAPDIYRVPLRISFGQETFRDGVDLAPAAFFQMLQVRKSFPKTSQPTAGDWEAVYARLLERYPALISIHIAGSISGTVAAAQAAALRLAPKRIHVIDSLQVSVGLGLVVEAIDQAIQQGASIAEVLSLARHVSNNVRIFGSVPSLKHAVRGGRVDARVAWLLERLGLKPIIEFDESGKPYKAGVSLGFGRALSALVKRAERYVAKDLSQAMVVHGNAPQLARQLAQKVQKKFGLEDVPQVQAGAVLGTHVGPGAVALAVRRHGSG